MHESVRALGFCHHSYPQLQGKIEAYNKIVKNEFLAVEDIPNIDDGKQRYDMLLKSTMKLENTEA